MIIKNAIQYYPIVFGKLKTLTLTLVLMKIAFIFPMLTSNFDSNSYISFLIWLLTGIWISMIQKEIEIKNAPAAIL
jgi:FtsH-binding integral membrane protein